MDILNQIAFHLRQLVGTAYRRGARPSNIWAFPVCLAVILIRFATGGAMDPAIVGILLGTCAGVSGYGSHLRSEEVQSGCANNGASPPEGPRAYPPEAQVA